MGGASESRMEHGKWSMENGAWSKEMEGVFDRVRVRRKRRGGKTGVREAGG